MKPPVRLSPLCLLAACLACTLGLAACAGIYRDPVHSSGTPVAPWSDPGGADEPGAASTGAQPRQY